MAKLTFTQDELANYFNGSLKHAAYDETVKMANDICIHAEGIYPQEMIEERRPSESIAVKEYRQKIWKPVTKPTFGKVITELNKIRRSADWSIKYDDSKVPPRIAPDETLKKYCEENYPFFSSITNWTFTALLSTYSKDSNAVVAVMPLDFELPVENEYLSPFGYLYKSENILEFQQNDYAIIKSNDKVIYKNADGASFFGDIIFVITTEKVSRYEETEDSFILADEYLHNFNKLPVFKVKGLLKKTLDRNFIYESRLSAMLPRLDEALREYSDLQAEIVQNIFSEKWEMVSDDCPKCKGKGSVKGAGFNASEMTCPVCGGDGARPRGPYSTLKVRQPMAGESAIPTPPAGYLQKTTDIVSIQDLRIDKHEYKALSAINMEYLAETPLNESGTAKEVDKDSLNNFVHSVAEDLVAVIDQLYFFINEYRYAVVVADENQRHDMLPYINVPDKFDLLSSTYLEDQIAKAKENKGNPIIINAMEEDYVNKKFVADNVLREKVLLSIRLDPLAGVGEDDKTMRLSNKGITLETYITSSNIQNFIARAIDEKGDQFFKMSLKDQKALMQQYAIEQKNENSASAKVLSLQPAETDNNITDNAVTV